MAFARFTPRQLEAFITVVDVHSFSRAGERLGLSPSAVSQLIAELESAVGFRIFDRTTRSVALSPAGREFLASAKSVLKHIDLADSVADDIRNRAAGIVRIAAPLVIASAILPAAIKAHTANHPKVVVRIRDAAVDNLVDMVSNADVDLAMGPDREVGNDVTRIRLFASPWVLWCAPAHPFARRRDVRWSELRSETLVAAGRDHERSVSEMHIGAPEEQRVAPIEIVDNISTALGIASQGLALTLAPAYVCVLAKAWRLAMRRVVDPEVTRHVCLYYATERAASPAAEGFREHLVEWIKGRNDSGVPPARKTT
jgi:DNA-binding transcriptional LysR family regulator